MTMQLLLPRGRAILMESMWLWFVHCTFDKSVLACGGCAAEML